MQELIDALNKSGKTDLELAELLNTSVPTIRRWKNGITAPHKSILEAHLKTMKKLETP